MVGAERAAGRPVPRLPVWARPRVAGRGPQPSLSVAAIVDAAVAVADAEGVAAVSMRRISGELGVGTMSLYRYVETKDDLLDLMTDQVMGENGFPEGHLDDWRTDLRRSAVGYRQLMLRHPWVLSIGASRPPLGPNVLRRTEWMLGTMGGLGLGIEEVSRLTGTVVAYVRGVVFTEIAEAEAVRRTGQTEDDYRRLVGPYLMQVLAAGEHPLMERFVLGADHEPDADRFFLSGLELVLDGISVQVQRAADAGGES